MLWNVWMSRSIRLIEKLEEIKEDSNFNIRDTSGHSSLLICLFVQLEWTINVM